MQPVEVSPGIQWIGVNDRTTDLFEGLWPITREGVSYNSYLVVDDKKAIIDLAKALKTDDFFEQIDQVTEIGSLDSLERAEVFSREQFRQLRAEMSRRSD